MSEVDPARHTAADHHCKVRHSQRSKASCSLWWRDTPEIAGERVGLIGRFRANCEKSATAVIQDALAKLSDQDCTLAIGPMDGTTWSRYRFAIDGCDEPPFFMEPFQPQHWPAWFVDNGFNEVARYRSSLQTDLQQIDPRVQKVEERLQKAGIRIRSLRLTQLQNDIRRIYPLAIRAFSKNFLFQPISENEFLHMYRSRVAFVDVRLCLIAEQDDEVVGFVFTVPDWNERLRTFRRRTLIIKTLAVTPGRRCAGLGILLWTRVYQRAAQLGYSRVINALMMDGNKSCNLAAEHSSTMRRYALYARRLH